MFPWSVRKRVLHPSHLWAFSLSEELSHRSIQLSELTERGADVSVEVLVFLKLVIENSFVLFPFFHTADLWILSVRKDFRESQ